ncbi:MAG: hypothetical protein NC211_04205 [Alistipes senegalensis]|nr:hypothetical protein [Oxalobacter formigenes]MCM1281019.1 hypothetical protein [Alistipes senegalensis]
MLKKRSGSNNKKFNLVAFLLHPAVSIIGGIFSLLAALLFGGFHFSRRKKKATETEARLTASRLWSNLEEVRIRLEAFRTWLEEQKGPIKDMKEAQIQYAGLKKLYSEWTSHERMEEILGTVQYDPKIGMNVSNGLHELRSLNIHMESVLRDGTADEQESRKIARMKEHVELAIGFFAYPGKDNIATQSGNKPLVSKKETAQ